MKRTVLGRVDCPVARALDEIQEKVEAQQSAGVEAARKRRADRLPAERTAVVDEGDKETARLLAGKTKKKKKKQPVKKDKDPDRSTHPAGS